MQSPVDREKLLAGLQQDVEDTSNQVKASGAGRGDVGEGDTEQQYLPKAIRYKGQQIHQKELGDLHNLISKSVDEIVNTNDRWSTAEKAKMRYDLNAKMHEYSMDVLNKTMRFGQHLKDMNLDEQGKQSSMQMWQNMMSGVTAGVIGYGNRPQSPAGMEGGGIGGDIGAGVAPEATAGLSGGPGVSAMPGGY